MALRDGVTEIVEVPQEASRISFNLGHGVVKETNPDHVVAAGCCGACGMTRPNQELAVILFNLGGPDSQDAVKPFLINLFRDKRIIGLPNPFRFALAHLIGSRKRSRIARDIYALLGGGSPHCWPTPRHRLRALETTAN